LTPYPEYKAGKKPVKRSRNRPGGNSDSGEGVGSPFLTKKREFPEGDKFFEKRGGKRRGRGNFNAGLDTGAAVAFYFRLDKTGAFSGKG